MRGVNIYELAHDVPFNVPLESINTSIRQIASLAVAAAIASENGKVIEMVGCEQRALSNHATTENQ